MRTIKFRAWDKKHKKMTKCFGYGKEYMVGGKGIDLNSLIRTEQEHLILMQYTGLKDKNNCEIWEGDIFKIIQKPTEVNEVEYNADGYLLSPHGLHLIDWYNGGMVIGNIYENEELLNE